MFLPALPIVINLLWAFICYFVDFLIGVFALLAFGLPDWTTAAIMFNNTASYPLLLIQSLEQIGILSKLLVADERTCELVGRAKSYFFVFATVSSCLAFVVGPRLIDTEHVPESDDNLTIDGEEENEPRLLSSSQPNRERRKSVTNITLFPSKPKFTTVKRRPRYIPQLHWSNPTLLGTLLGVLIGMTPVLHRAFFSSTYNGAVFTAWLTESWKNIGRLLVPLPFIFAGISLYTLYKDLKQSDGSTARASTPLATTAFILMIRFIMWPIISSGVIYAIVKHSSALESLITMVQVSDAGVEDERKIAKILATSYIISPILVVVVVGALYVSKAAM
ncbi:hypothetical protein BU25DRAFT_435186 [Macroventuria anomochaeta]|uniref:Uncharacterized protein n=1 Tax=Macroventuria anomochaeta TaxID=301207 RepID=A0ACB6RLD8_9PLEO|nr:uncharacterized protein BU25DRAFT_435186 [Macroventuria anomochaeta]KAF2621974.1 hypothetical protein BU25DRAFT_435186 [Macroventuria anomochaeta]